MSKIKTWMPVYIGDYLADTMRLTTLQHGAYFLLMMEYWRQGPLPADMDELAAIARTDRKTWDKAIWPTLKRFFSSEDDGLLHQKRADKELAHAQSVSNKRRDAVQQRRDRSNAKDMQNDNKRHTNVDTKVGDLNIQNANKEGDTCASCASASPSPSHISSLCSDIESCSPSAPADAKKPDPRGHRLPDDWRPSDEDRAFALGLSLNPTDVEPQFRDYWHSVAGAKGRKVDWSATWRGWCRREIDRGQGAKVSAIGGRQPSRQERVKEAFANAPTLKDFGL